MILRLITGVCLTSLVSFQSAASADTLSEYLSLVVGSFDSSAQAAADERYDHAIWHTGEIWTGDTQSRWTYTENWLEGMPAPYRQRISRYTVEDDGSIRVDSFRVPDAETRVGSWKNPELLDDLSPADLGAAGTCPARLARTGPRRFEGGTDGQRCRNNYKGASYMVSRSLTSVDGVENWDRGFTADGTLAWGPASGPYRFRRSESEATSCAEPVLMLVYGEIFDRPAFGAYVGALAESGLYAKNGGYYRAISPAIDVFEGEPPAGRGVVLSRFPCAQAARRFWDSPEYQRIKTLRKDKASFEVLLLKELPVPSSTAD